MSRKDQGAAGVCQPEDIALQTGLIGGVESGRETILAHTGSKRLNGEGHHARRRTSTAAGVLGTMAVFAALTIPALLASQPGGRTNGSSAGLSGSVSPPSRPGARRRY